MAISGGTLASPAEHFTFLGKNLDLFAGSHRKGWKGWRAKEQKRRRLRSEIAFQSRKRNRRR